MNRKKTFILLFTLLVFSSGCSLIRFRPTREELLLPVQQGIASYYGSEFVGKKTASGETYHHEALTAAHPALPFGTLVRVTDLLSKNSVVVRINDRGPFVFGRIIDLSRSAAEQLGIVQRGIAEVTIEKLLPEDSLDPTDS